MELALAFAVSVAPTDEDVISEGGDTKRRLVGERVLAECRLRREHIRQEPRRARSREDCALQFGSFRFGESFENAEDDVAHGA